MIPSSQIIQAAADRIDKLRAKGQAAPSHSRAGVIISTPIDGGPPTVSDLVACGHCDRIWLWLPGSGNRRGFCTRCGKITCGSEFCSTLGCSHREQRLDNLEAGRALDFRPVQVSTAGLLIPA